MKLTVFVWGTAIAHSTIEQKGRFALAALAGVAALALVIWSVTFHRHLADMTPTPGDWETAAKLVAERLQTGDRVAIVPFWATSGEKPFAVRNLPYQFVQRVAQESWPDAQRLWVVSGYERFADRDAFLARGAKPLETHQVGPLDVELFAVPWGVADTYFFWDHLAEAEVEVKRGAASTPCDSWNEETERFVCSHQADWQYVGRLRQELGNAVRRTIWAHPVSRTEIVIRFLAVPATRRVVVEHGLTGYAAANRPGAPVFIEARVDGRPAGRVVQQNEDGWFSDEILLGAFPGERHDIELIVTTPDDGRRHFSFSGYAQ